MKKIFIFIMLILLTIQFELIATVYYVKTDGNDKNSGLSWGNAFADFQKALNVAKYGDEIWVAEGTYKPSITYGLNTDERGKHFRMLNGVAIYGGFNAVGNPTLEDRNWEKYPTVLSGDIGIENDSTDNCYHVFFHPADMNLDSNSILDGFVITKGSAFSQGTNGYGAGMANYSGNFLIRNCTFRDNTAFSGGGVLNNNCSPHFYNCFFERNIAYENGGGVYNILSGTEFLNCIFKSNNCSFGGGINNNEGNILIINCLFIFNHAMSASAIYNFNKSNSKIVNCTFTNNKVDYSSCAILNYGNLSIHNSIVWGNNNQYAKAEVANAGTCKIANSCLSIGISNITDTVNCVIDDPQFISLGENPCMIYSSSPCVDAGNNEYIDALNDIRGEGFQRKLNKGNGSPGIVDIGCYEYNYLKDVKLHSPKLLYPYNNAHFISKKPAFQWNKVENAKKYRIQVTKDTNFNNLLTDEIVNDTIFYIKELEENTYYFWRVKAINEPDESLWSEIFIFQTNYILYVKSAATGKNDGTSWENAFTSFQTALDSAKAGYQIWVAEGTYKPSYDYGLNYGERCKHFRMFNGVAILGGFPAVGNPDTTQRDYKKYPTILSGDIGEIGNDKDNCFHIIYNPPELNLNRSAELDGFVITKGNANDASKTYSEGGCICNYGSITLLNCILKDNHAKFGGGFLNSIGYSLVQNCVFLDNSSSNGGAGISNFGYVKINQCTFNNNISNEGGAIYNYGGLAHITNSFFNKNIASTGGAIYQYKGELGIANSILYNNNAINGGAIYNYHSFPDIANSTIYNNYALYGGAMYNIWELDDYCTFKNSIIWGNIAISSGNQFHSYSEVDICYVELINCCYSNKVGDIVGGEWAKNCINVDPKLALRSNPSHPLSLTSESPCVDIGIDKDVGKYDIRGVGFPRKLSRNSLDSGRIDIGAYEFNYVTDTTQPIENSIIYVNKKANGNNDGSSWENAFTDLHSALWEAVDTDEIWVAQGIYKPSYDYGLNIGERGKHFRMKPGVAIYGGFPNNGNPNFEERDWEKYSTILSGDIGVENDTSDNCYHIIFNNYYPLLPSNSVLDGFTITNGNSNGNNDTNNRGGGISNIRSNPTIKNCTFTKNYGLYGGAVSNWYYSCPFIDNCIFFENYSDNGGAIVNIKSSNTVIKSSTFNKNSAKENGGAINNISSNSLIKYCNFIENSAKENGGAIYNISISSGTSYINSIFYKNKAKLGGSFFSSSGKINIINSLIFENYAEYGAGLYNLPDALTTIDNSILWSNFTDSTVDTGEQIYLKGGVVNCNFSCIPNNPNDVYGYPSFHYCIEKNPLLIENKDFYFNLSENSPCINKGSNALLPEYILTDIFGNERIYDDIVDIGPFEFQPINVPKLLTPADSRENITIDSLFTWTAVYSATLYQLQLSSQTPENIIIDTILTQTLFRAKELAFSTTYFWKVRAISDSDTSSWSAIWSFTTLSDVHTPWNFTSENKRDLSILCKPNPATENTIIQFDLPFKSSVEIKLYNYCGIELQSIYKGDLGTGRYDILLNTAKLQKGIYFVVLRTKEKIITTKLVIEK